MQFFAHSAEDNTTKYYTKADNCSFAQHQQNNETTVINCNTKYDLELFNSIGVPYRYNSCVRYTTHSKI